MTDSQATEQATENTGTDEAAGTGTDEAAAAGATGAAAMVGTNPLAPAPAGARTAADVVTPELVAQLTKGVVGSGRTANHTPFTGEKLADLPESTPEDVQEAFERARKAQVAWGATPYGSAPPYCSASTTLCLPARPRSST